MAETLRNGERPNRQAGIPCRSCGRRIVFVRMPSGKRMPVHAEMTYGDGRKNLVVRVDGEYRLMPKAPSDALGREVHWGNCS